MANGIVLALGMFDGVHLGHCTLLSYTALKARELGASSVVLSFQNHPLALLTGSIQTLSTPEERVRRIQLLGVERVELIPFTREFADLEPTAFVDYLVKRYPEGIRELVVGFNYSFGAKGGGDPKLLTKLGKERGFPVTVMEPVLCDGAPISSSRIREALRSGDMTLAKRLLWRPYVLTGKVVHGKGLGRTLGFPTANMETGERLLPKDGVYATGAFVDGAWRCAVTNVGTNPTVGGQAHSVESFLTDDTEELYGRELSVAFLKYLREEQTFPSAQALQAQIAKDAAEAKIVFADRKKELYSAEGLC